MLSLSVETFDAFYRENEDITKLFEFSDHSIDETKFSQWKVAMLQYLAQQPNNALTRQLIDFTNNFNLNYVSIQEFKVAVRDVVTEMYETIAMNYDDIVLILGNEINKSSLWVTMLAWPLLRQFQFDNLIVVASTDTKWITERLETSPHRSILTLYFDDASYSGSQYSTTVGRFRKAKNTTWTHAVMIPFITQRARAAIRQKFEISYLASVMPSIWFPTKAREIPIYNPNLLWSDGYPQTSVWADIFQNILITKRALTYFQHKLADDISLYTFIMRSAPIPTGQGGDMNIGPSFIRNCGPNDTLTPFTGSREYVKQYQLKSDCYLPPYKQHIFKFRGRIIDRDKGLLQVNKCINCGSIGKMYRLEGHPIDNGVVCSKHCQKRYYAQ